MRDFESCWEEKVAFEIDDEFVWGGLCAGSFEVDGLAMEEEGDDMILYGADEAEDECKHT